MSRWGHHPATEILDCPWCASVHLGALVVFLRWKFPKAWPYTARALAASQVTGMAAEIGH